MSSAITASIFRTLVVSLIAVGASAFASTMSPAGAQEIPAKAAAAQALAGTLSQQGRVRVIVRLSGDYRAEQELAGPEGIEGSRAVAAQRAMISRAQTQVLTDLTGTAVQSVKRFGFVPLMSMTVDGPGLDALVGSPNVVGIQEDLPVPPTLFQSVPLIGGNVSTGFGGFSGAGQMVAVLDTGVWSSHPFLSGKVLSEACYSTNDAPFGISSVCPGGVAASTAAGSGAPCLLSIAGCDHGTHVAGIAAGKTTDIAGTLYSGVAKDASILAIQVFSRIDDMAANGFLCSAVGLSSPCALTFTSDQILGLERVYALRTTYNIAAANMSLGGGFSSSFCDADTRKPIIDLLRAAGIATVIASGNNGFENGVSEPACISSAVTVGSSTKTDTVSWFSNNSPLMVDLLAPGSSIGSSIPLVSYAVKDGTSMATPHVAGAFAVLKSKTPAATLTEMEIALRLTGTTIAETRLGVFFSKPRINLDQALVFTPPSQNVVGDFGGDFQSDILWRNTTTGDNTIWTIDAFLKASADPTDGVPNPWYVADIADFDDDGRSDILWRYPTTTAVNIWTMDVNVKLSGGQIGAVNSNWVVKGIADFDGDGLVDILWRNQANGNNIIWQMNGLTKLAAGSIGTVPSVWSVEGVADFSGDGKADILWRDSSTGTIVIWQMNGFAKEAVLSLGAIPVDWRIEGVVDFNGGGQPDILWRNTSTLSVVIWQMNGYTKEASGSVGGVSLIWQVARLGDYNGDGQGDILWRNLGSGENIIWEMNGITKLAAHPLSPVLGWSVQ